MEILGALGLALALGAGIALFFKWADRVGED